MDCAVTAHQRIKIKLSKKKKKKTNTWILPEKLKVDHKVLVRQIVTHALETIRLKAMKRDKRGGTEDQN